MFAGVGGFREGLTAAGGFTCVGHCEIDAHANKSYNALFDTKGEFFCEDARQIDPAALPDFDLLCGGFPCQAFSVAGNRKGFADPRGTLFFELARLAEARHPAYLLFENVPGLLSHDGGRTFAAILHALEKLGYYVEWQVLNSADHFVPQSRKRVYIVGYLDKRCAGKIFPFLQANPQALRQVRGGSQGSRIYDPTGLSCTLTAGAGGKGGKTGLYRFGVPIKEATKCGYKMAYDGDSIDLSYATMNSRRGRVGDKLAHTLTTSCTQGTLQCIDLNTDPQITPLCRCLHTRQNNGLHSHKGECSGVLVPTAQCDTENAVAVKDTVGGRYCARIRKLTARECLRLQGWKDERIDVILSTVSEGQAYKQAGNGVTTTVVEAIGRRIAAMHAELHGGETLLS